MFVLQRINGVNIILLLPIYRLFQLHYLLIVLLLLTSQSPHFVIILPIIIIVYIFIFIVTISTVGVRIHSGGLPVLGLYEFGLA